MGPGPINAVLPALNPVTLRIATTKRPSAIPQPPWRGSRAARGHARIRAPVTSMRIASKPITCPRVVVHGLRASTDTQRPWRPWASACSDPPRRHLPWKVGLTGPCGPASAAVAGNSHRFPKKAAPRYRLSQPIDGHPWKQSGVGTRSSQPAKTATCPCVCSNQVVSSNATPRSRSECIAGPLCSVIGGWRYGTGIGGVGCYVFIPDGPIRVSLRQCLGRPYVACLP